MTIWPMKLAILGALTLALIPAAHAADWHKANPNTLYQSYGQSGYFAGTDSSGNLQPPSATVRGGVMAATAPTNQFQTGVSTAGAPVFAQPAFGNLSGTATLSQLPTIPASQTSGLLPLTGGTLTGTITNGTLSGTNISAAAATGTGLYNSQSPATRTFNNPDILDFASTAQAAIAKLVTLTSSYTTRIPVGTYSVSALDNLFSAGQSFRGAGIGRTIIQLPASCSFPTGGLFHWAAKPYVQIADLTIDMNGCAPASGSPGAISISGASGGVVVQNVQVINAGAGFDVLTINHSSNVYVDNFECSATVTTATGHCIAIQTGAGATDNVWVLNSTLSGSAIGASGTRLHFIGNDISGWNYGSGITLAQGTSPGAIVIGNNIHDSGTALDAQNTAPLGIEGWSKGATIENNRISNVAGNCILAGEPGVLVADNWCSGPGKNTPIAAFVAAHSSSTETADGSFFVGNSVVSDGTSSATYGYQDYSGVSGVYLSGNNFSGAVAPYQINSASGTAFGSIFLDSAGRWLNADTAAPGASTSKTIRVGTGTLIVSPSASGFTYTVTMPPGAPQGQPVTIIFDKAMTTTFAGSGSDTIVNPITSVTAGQRVTLTYSGTAWH